MTLPCMPTQPIAQAIVKACELAWPANNDDCNKFVKAALADFLAAGYFDGLNADAMVGKMKQAAEAWILTTSIAAAIVGAKAGKVVIAGMTSEELGQKYGHLAIVVGCDGQHSGAVSVPVGYAGSLHNESARLNGGRLSGTFLATTVQEEGINYFITSATA